MILMIWKTHKRDDNDEDKDDDGNENKNRERERKNGDLKRKAGWIHIIPGLNKDGWFGVEIDGYSFNHAGSHIEKQSFR